MKRVLDVGNCSMDHGSVRNMLQKQFGCEVKQAHLLDDALAELRKGEYDLVLVNRKLDADYSDGLEIIKAIKADPQLAKTPVMLLTNYAEHQAEAVAEGALLGFGKKQIHDAVTRELLAPLLKE